MQRFLIAVTLRRMASDSQVYVRIDGDTVARVAALGHTGTEDRGWLQLGDLDDRVAIHISGALPAIVVVFSIDTVVDQTWIRAWEAGRQVRELRIASGERWTNWGVQFPFEAKAELRTWLKRRRVLASPDGYDVLAAFLGHPNVSPLKDVIEPDATTTWYLSAALVTEASTLGTVSEVLRQAWELGRRAAYDQQVSIDGPVSLAAPDVVIGSLAHEPKQVAPLTLGPTVKCALAVPQAMLDELARMQRAFGEPAMTLLTNAYLAARPRLV